MENNFMEEKKIKIQGLHMFLQNISFKEISLTFWERILIYKLVFPYFSIAFLQIKIYFLATLVAL